MAFTPEQIEGASFSTVKRGGYRTEEVDRFLRTLADEVRTFCTRVRSAEGANEDLQAASTEMATLMRDVHAQLGEKRRLAENEVQEMLQSSEREAAGIIAGATEEADAVRLKSDRVLADAEHHAEVLRSDGEQRVREQAQETLRVARAELQDLVRRKHEILRALTALRGELTTMENNIEATALTPGAIDDNIVNQTLIDLREAQAVDKPAGAAVDEWELPPAPALTDAPLEASAPASAGTQAPATPPAASPEGNAGTTQTHPAAPESNHPVSSSGTFFRPPDEA